MKTFHKKKSLFLYGMGGMGVNMLNLVIGSYLCDAVMTAGFDKNIEYWTYANKTLVTAIVWSVMITIAKIIDAVIDIPLASFADRLGTKWGKRRPALLMGLIPMMLAFVAFLNPISGEAESLANTIWLGVFLMLFYVFYTLTMGTYYATFSEVTDNEKDRVLLSNYKTVFDIVYFLLGYGLIPLMISPVHLNIRVIGYIFLPLALTMLIPIFMIKEGSTLKKDIGKEGSGEKGVNILKAIKYCFTNKSFMIWMAIYALLQFGLQMFIAGENVYYSNGAMGFDGWKITLVMAAVFVPIPFTLLLYNKIVRKAGIQSGFVFSLLAFGIAMAIMGVCNSNIIANDTLRLVLAIIGGLTASFGIGCFFSISYTIPSHLADLQKKETGDSNPSMYFAVQGLFSGIATAISTGVVWVNLKEHYTWALPIIVLCATTVTLWLSFLLPKKINSVGLESHDAADGEKADNYALDTEEKSAENIGEAQKQETAVDSDTLQSVSADKNTR
ncbi:MAG: MFS transporter [Clostridiales bacterium]|nr:MFS transporter [Clostridiales bacterium]